MALVDELAKTEPAKSGLSAADLLDEAFYMHATTCTASLPIVNRW